MAPPPKPREADGGGEIALDFRIVKDALLPIAPRPRRGGGPRASRNSWSSAQRRQGEIPDEGTQNIELDRGDVSKIAAAIKEKFPEFSERKIAITSLQDKMVSLSVGEKDGVKQGFTGYVVKQDEKTGVNTASASASTRRRW